MMILETISLEQAWLIPHLIVNSSASMLVMNKAWCTVLVRGQFCYDLKLKGLSNKTTLVLSNTRELDRVPSTK